MDGRLVNDSPLYESGGLLRFHKCPGRLSRVEATQTKLQLITGGERKLLDALQPGLSREARLLPGAETGQPLLSLIPELSSERLLRIGRRLLSYRLYPKGVDASQMAKQGGNVPSGTSPNLGIQTT